MKTVNIRLQPVRLGTVAGHTDGWLILTGEDVIHGLVHLVNEEDYTLSSSSDERLQAFGWCPLFDSLDDLIGDLEIALAMDSAAEVEAWLEQSERHDH